jgi:hypothetical protein
MHEEPYLSAIICESASNAHVWTCRRNPLALVQMITSAKLQYSILCKGGINKQISITIVRHDLIMSCAELSGLMADATGHLRIQPLKINTRMTNYHWYSIFHQCLHTEYGGHETCLTSLRPSAYDNIVTCIGSRYGFWPWQWEDTQVVVRKLSIIPVRFASTGHQESGLWSTESRIKQVGQGKRWIRIVITVSHTV